MRAPSYISGINWASPLTQELIAAWIVDSKTTLKTIHGFGDIGVALTVDNIANASFAVDPQVGLMFGAGTAAWVGTLPRAISGSLTIAGWATSPSGIQQWAFSMGPSTLNTTPHVGIDVSGLWSSNIWGDTVTTTAPAVGALFHWAMTLLGSGAGTTLQQYLNGVDAGSTTVTWDGSAASTEIKFKGLANRTTSYNAKLKNVEVWDRALSAREIYALYKPTTRWDIYRKGSPTIFLGYDNTTTTVTAQANTSFGQVLSPVTRNSRIFLPRYVGDLAAPVTESTPTPATSSQLVMII